MHTLLSCVSTLIITLGALATTRTAVQAQNIPSEHYDILWHQPSTELRLHPTTIQQNPIFQDLFQDKDSWLIHCDLESAHLLCQSDTQDFSVVLDHSDLETVEWAQASGPAGLITLGVASPVLLKLQQTLLHRSVRLGVIVAGSLAAFGILVSKRQADTLSAFSQHTLLSSADHKLTPEESSDSVNEDLQQQLPTSQDQPPPPRLIPPPVSSPDDPSLSQHNEEEKRAAQKPNDIVNTPSDAKQFLELRELFLEQQNTLSNERRFLELAVSIAIDALTRTPDGLVPLLFLASNSSHTNATDTLLAQQLSTFATESSATTDTTTQALPNLRDAKAFMDHLGPFHESLELINMLHQQAALVNRVTTTSQLYTELLRAYTFTLLDRLESEDFDFNTLEDIFRVPTQDLALTDLPSSSASLIVQSPYVQSLLIAHAGLLIAADKLDLSPTRMNDYIQAWSLAHRNSGIDRWNIHGYAALFALKEFAHRNTEPEVDRWNRLQENEERHLHGLLALGYLVQKVVSDLTNYYRGVPNDHPLYDQHQVERIAANAPIDEDIDKNNPEIAQDIASTTTILGPDGANFPPYFVDVFSHSHKYLILTNNVLTHILKTKNHTSTTETATEDPDSNLYDDDEAAQLALTEIPNAEEKISAHKDATQSEDDKHPSLFDKISKTVIRIWNAELF